MSANDPFAPQNDPYLSASEAHRTVTAGVTRRTAGALLLGLVGIITNACAPLRLACRPKAVQEDPGCNHRFCRYHKGP